MQRTISAMVGKGSVNHNSRKFKAENVDGIRTHLNIDYCNEPIKKIYHELFDEALKRYNEKQTRVDRRIENYYEKIRNSKQEKPFHELILQIGDKENMSAESENGQLARQILDEYYRGFQERNPNLKVFSAHLHMDEATPHLHIDFVPFTTGSKRGLDTRVSLKQALAAQGFKGGTRGDTEWNQWVSAEKSALAFVMERHGIEWEHKGTHEKHLSVLDYKKQERATELEQLGAKIEEKQAEFRNDVCSFANADGGYIFYGIGETSGVASILAGISIPNIDHFELDRRNELQAIRPTVPDVTFSFISLQDDKYIVVLHIQRGLYKPYITEEPEGQFHFYIRHGNKKQAMLSEDIKSFRKERLEEHITEMKKLFALVQLIPATFRSDCVPMYDLYREGKLNFDDLFNGMIYDRAVPNVDGMEQTSLIYFLNDTGN
mgnify:CR=1 FL=1